MPTISLIPGGSCLDFGGRGIDPRGVQLFALGMPDDHRPKPPPKVHGEASGSETFNLSGILQAEEICGGSIALMRVGFVPDRIATMDSLACPIPGSSSWSIGHSEWKNDVFALGPNKRYRGVAFLAADSGFCQIAIFHGGTWVASYLIHIGFYNLAPKGDPTGISLVEAVVNDIKRRRWATSSTSIISYYGMGICPEWYGVGDDYIKHIITRYGDDADALVRTPSAGPRKGNAQSISLQAMLDAEFERTHIKEICEFAQLSVEGPESCPAAMRNASGEPVLWSAVREAGTPNGNSTARNLVFYTLPH